MPNFNKCADRSSSAESIRTDATVIASRLLRGGAILSALALVAACSSSSNAGGTAETSPTVGPDRLTTAPAAAGNPAHLGRAVLLEGSRHLEVSQYGPTTFADYITVSGAGPVIPEGDTVIVDCVATGPEEAAPSARGKWYHIVEPPELAGTFAAANTFWNQEPPQQPDLGNPVDPNVPPCPNPVG